MSSEYLGGDIRSNDISATADMFAVKFGSFSESEEVFDYS